MTERASRRALEEQLKLMSVYLPIVIWMTNAEHQVTFISRNWFDLIGAHVMDPNAWLEAVDPNQRQAVLTRITRVIKLRRPLTLEFRLARPDGSFANVLSMGAPCFNSDGAYAGYVGALIDVSERRSALEALQNAEARLSSALEGTNVGVWDWDIRTGEVWLSDSALAIQGFRAGEVKPHAKHFYDYIHRDDVPDFKRRLRAVFKGEEALFNSEHRLRRKEGGWVWILERGRVLERDENGRAVRMIGTRSDMTERREAEEHIRWLAAHDVLTELPNRGRFQELLSSGIDAAERSGVPVGLLFIDLDEFKQVNDTAGHEAGDDLLRRVADRLRTAFPAPATVARLGGDEFAIVLPGAGPDELAAFAERALAQDFAEDGRPGTTISVGAASYPAHALDTRDLLRFADIALYRAKAAGRACAVVYEPGSA
jgi:diguanylate cyclase (GGDEF)-like protein/PAS domain S-box-containing protein